MSINLILYSKPGCHLCEGLQEKLTQVQNLDLVLEVRDITTRDDWFQAYEYEIPVLVLVRSQESGVRSQESEVRNQKARETVQDSNLYSSSFSLHPSSLIPLPRLSPRATVLQLEQMLRKYLEGR